APAPAADAEQQVNQASDGQQQDGNDEVLDIENLAACGSIGQRQREIPLVIPQHAGQAGHQDEQAADHGSLLAGPAKAVDAAGHDVIKNRQDGGEAGKGHEQEEQRTPDPTAYHVDKDTGQGHKNQRGTGVGLHTESEAGRENDQAGHQSHKRVQRTDANGFAGERVFLGHVAAEDFHGRNAEAQGKESLVHGRRNHVAQTHFGSTLDVRQQVEGKALFAALQHNAVDSQHHDQK